MDIRFFIGIKFKPEVFLHLNDSRDNININPKMKMFFTKKKLNETNSVHFV